MAPNTAMLSSVPPITLAPWSAPSANHTVSITARPSSAPATMAMCGVLRVPCVIDSARGK